MPDKGLGCRIRCVEPREHTRTDGPEYPGTARRAPIKVGGGMISALDGALGLMTLRPMLIRSADPGDHDALWHILEPVIRAGETYALPRDMTRQDALAYWLGPDRETFVAEIDGIVVGSGFLRANQAGGGAHVANCGYVVASGQEGCGVGGTLCDHSLDQARSSGFRAMQFNFVVSTNEGAVRLWHAKGFETVGRLPRAFDHPRFGPVDALVMFRDLDA